MSHSKEAGRLILADLKLFNQTAVLFEEELAPDIYAAFAKAFEAEANARGWSSDGDPGDIDNSWLAPPQWSFKDAAGEDDANPYFGLLPLDKGPSYRLADLCGVGSTRVTLRLVVKEKALGFPGGPAWKKSLKAVCEKYVARLPIGFVYDEPNFYLPLELDSTKLADAWADDHYDELFEPLIPAFDALEKSVPIFVDMIAEMRATPP